MRYDEVLTHIGEFGTYQRIQYILLAITSLTSAWHSMNMVFVGATPDHHCKIPDQYRTHYGNISETQLYNLSLPTELKDGNTRYKRCQMYHLINNTDDLYNRSEQACTNGWVYSKEKYQRTIVSDWNLVCGDIGLRSSASSIFFAGRLVGALMFGQLSDFVGRKLSFFIAVVLQCAIGTGAAFSPSLIIFYVLYFFQGVMQVGVYLSAYVLGSEILGPKFRTYWGVGNQYFYAIGQMLLALLGYLIRDWRYIEIAISAPLVLYLTYWWLVPESPRWLLVQDRTKEAKAIIRKTAKVNRVDVSEKILDSLTADTVDPSGKAHSVIDLFRNWKIISLSLLVWLGWLINALVYYGLGLNTRNLAGDPYLNFFFSGLVEIPGVAVVHLTIDRFGRKPVLCGFMLFGGLACICTSFIPTNLSWLATLLAMIGKFAITGSYAVIYLVATEVFPTCVRNVGCGMASMSARIGGILAPQIVLLGEYVRFLPFLIYGGLSIGAALLMLLLPETRGRPLPQTMEDMYNYSKRPTEEESKDGKDNIAFQMDNITDNALNAPILCKDTTQLNATKL
ncbi:unnamed protein product [Owenia fusiformis]|uniref:Major facilitator superfamily (MFS) profile domain-containing protein n=1 Tax=Owenia fusiformis TaxID=6347 RepID=A0A8S4NNP5_OWEFU|nr:unnamed protein product [Owenia fusiformis]